MPKLRLDIAPYEGEYEIPKVSELSNGEFHRIYQICGVSAGEFVTEIQKGNIGLLVAFTAVILERQDIQPDLSLLWGAKPEAFEMVKDHAKAEEDEDRPPASATTGGEKNENAVVANDKPNTSPSGSNGEPAGDGNPDLQPPTGRLGSEQLDSDLAISPI